jgi:MFS family permease
MLVPIGLGQAIANVGWRGGLQAIALLVALVALPLLVFRFWNHPADAGADPETSPGGAGVGTGGSEGLATNRDILTRPAFWLFALAMGFFLATYTAAVTNLGQFYADLSLPAEDAPSVMFVIASFGILGKLSFGYLADRMPLKVGLIAAIGATACSFCLFATEPGYGILLVGAAAMGLASGGILPVWNAMVPAIFGVQNFGRAMGWMSPIIGVLVTPSFVLVGMVRDSTGSYVLAFQGFLGVLLVAALLLAPLRVGGAESAAGSPA